MNLLELPTEILLIILKKLDNVDVLYSLFDVNNQRLGMIIEENTFTNTLNFVLTTSTDDTSSISDPIVDRFCISILPRIHYNVKSLILNTISMERILLAADYPNLCELKIFHFNDKIASQYFTVESPLQRIFQRQITNLTLVFENDFNDISCEHYTTDVYGYILQFFENLKYLSVIGSFPNFFPPLVLLNLPLSTFYSSSLHKLCIRVMYYDDLLALLDGRLKQLNTLNVVIINRKYNSTNNYNTNNLPHLKCFDLRYDCFSDTYDNQVLPLLRRMLNIEALNLDLSIDNQTAFIDGKHLYNEIIVHMPRLRKFNFGFFFLFRLDHPVHHLSKDDILQTFPNIIYQQVDCIIRHRRRHDIWHVFSLPYMFDYLAFIGNTFPNIIFNRVIRLVLEDQIPFDHAFFIRIAWSFPLLKVLCIFNLIPPQTPISNKLSSHDTQLYSTIIEYPHLTSLNVGSAHQCYIEQFLNEKKTHLPRLTKLTVCYYMLVDVTRNFRNDTTRLNCMKVKQLSIGDVETIVDSEDFHVYFPSL